jgi:hypothetical protein
MGTDIHGPFLERAYAVHDMPRWEAICAFDWGRDYLVMDLLCGARHGRQPETLPELPVVDEEAFGYQWLDHNRWMGADCWGHHSVTPDQLEEVIRRYAAYMERSRAEHPESYNQGGMRSHEPEPNVLLALRVARIAEEAGRPVRLGFCFDN